MSRQLYANGTTGSTLGSALTAGGLSITLTAGHGARFPSPGTGEYFLLTLADAAEGGATVEFGPKRTL